MLVIYNDETTCTDIFMSLDMLLTQMAVRKLSGRLENAEYTCKRLENTPSTMFVSWLDFYFINSLLLLIMVKQKHIINNLILKSIYRESAIH